MGRKLDPSLKAEVVTDTKARPEGWRVKHGLARNWVKVYDKVSVLRVETTPTRTSSASSAPSPTTPAGARGGGRP